MNTEYLLITLLLAVIAMLLYLLVRKLPQNKQYTAVNDIEIDQLLHRQPIQINDSNIFEQVSGKRILITGAAGSIGSEIARQLSKYHPGMVILCDQAESALYDIHLDMQERFHDVTIRTHLVSIRNVKRLRRVFAMYRPQFVFHAAAYKHVPMMENDPGEAILTNVLGTMHVADLSVHYGVDKFVMISTDKAVNPTGIMGASKRIAEIYVQSLNNQQSGSTRFMTTRFGNVMDSNGSVIPRFRKQIKAGGPVTVTHPEITRYFMTIPEAVQLVLEAASIGKGGEVFVFDMGEPVRISDLAKNMIRLAGLKVDKDIKIVYTGLRPGEKLYEELLNNREQLQATNHNKIKIASGFECDVVKLKFNIQHLANIDHYTDREELIARIRNIIPEFSIQTQPTSSHTD